MKPRAANRVSVTVVTYTYNDQDLAHGLVEAIGDWTVAPRELIVVDDGSEEPFVMRGVPDGVAGRIIRHATNLGPTMAKQAGLSAASARFILSLDSDTRIDDDWLEKCLPLAGQDGVGMVSTPILYSAGETLTAEYLRRTYSYLSRPGETGMIPGPAFVMRKAVFDEVGGLAGYGERLGEDKYLSDLLLGRGYRLMITDASRARQTRRLSRTTAVRRGFVWQRSAFFPQIDKGTPLSEVATVFIYSVSRRPCLQGGCLPCLAYHDLLYCAYGLACLASRFPGQFEGLMSFLCRHLGRHVGLREFLARDLRQLGFDLDETADCVDYPPFRRLFPEDLCAAIDSSCQGELAQGEEDEDFSMYKHMA